MQDDELVLRLRARDEAAFAALVHTHQPALLRAANAIVQNAAVAEEVVQETWMAVYRGIDGFEGRSSLRTWIFRILLRRARSTVRHEHRSAPVPEDDLDMIQTVVGWPADTGWDDEVGDRIVAVDQVTHIRELLRLLPPLQRDALLLRDIEGATADEVTHLLGISPGNLRVLLHRGRHRVRAALETDKTRT